MGAAKVPVHPFMIRRCEPWPTLAGNFTRMPPLLRNILALPIGLVLCMGVNGLLIQVGGMLVPLPAAIDPNDLDSFAANQHLLGPQHYAMPFLAHALGSLVGALVAALVAASRRMTFAMLVGVVHLAGGIAAAYLIPAPVWFIVLDLGSAYLPMAWLGGRIITGRRA